MPPSQRKKKLAPIISQLVECARQIQSDLGENFISINKEEIQALVFGTLLEGLQSQSILISSNKVSTFQNTSTLLNIKDKILSCISDEKKNKWNHFWYQLLIF